jgi:hypothetical protein
MPCELNKKPSVPKETEYVVAENLYAENNTQALEPIDDSIMVVTNESEDIDMNNLSKEDLTRNYSLKQLRDMCKQQSLSNVGNKKELAERLEEKLKDLSD